MNSETRNCQNCKQNFTIESEDFGFYEKIKVPPPTWCPECRFLRRTLWRNQWRFFKKKEERTGQLILSLFPADSPVKIYEREYWYSDAWDALEFGREYDFSRTFFAQFADLLYMVPFPSRSINDLVNSDYSMNAGWLKNCYLVFDANYCEDSAYLVDAAYANSCFDGLSLSHCELCYNSAFLEKCYKAVGSVNCEDCQDIVYSRDCVGCSSCVGCANLRKKSYCIFNEQYSREAYLTKLSELDLHTSFGQAATALRAYEIWKKFPYRFANTRHTDGVSGNYIFESRNVKNSYRVIDGENLKYCQLLMFGPNRDSYDYSVWGHATELMYESAVCGQGTSNIRFSWQSWGEIRNLEYCVMCQNCSDCFGCVGLRKKQYCILNQQYSKEEYDVLREKIIENMNITPYVDANNRTYRYGEFFPPELSPFAYNDTVARELFPLSKSEVLARGIKWRDPEPKPHQATIAPEMIPDALPPDDSIAQETLGCEHKGECDHDCSVAFRVIPAELAFYRKLNLPLPRLCSNCRHFELIRFRNPIHIYDRTCAKCSTNIQTSYAPDRPEIIYCESCYNNEVA